MILTPYVFCAALLGVQSFLEFHKQMNTGWTYVYLIKCLYTLQDE
jgi:hypothetical protein